jgi:hypothetical protein
MNCDCGQNFWLYETDEFGNLIVDGGWAGESIGEDIVNDVEFQTNIAYMFGGLTSSWGSAGAQAGDEDLYIGKKLSANGNQYYSVYADAFGYGGNDEVLAIDLAYDNGIVAIGNLNYNSIGGSNLVIIKIDKDNNYGSFDVLTDLVSDDITLSFDELISDENLKIYPSLFSNNITIEELPERNTIKIFSNTGRLVFESTNESFNTLDLGHFSNGLYILNIQTEEYNISKKIIKN